MPVPSAPILLVRFRPEAVVGERDRVCHLVPLPESDQFPNVLRALCGTEISPGSAELVTKITGMPCEPCMGKLGNPLFAALRAVPPPSVRMEIADSNGYLGGDRS